MSSQYKPMLAGKTSVDGLRSQRYPMLLSPKLDGFRAIVTLAGSLRSRKLEPIPNQFVNDLVQSKDCAGFDGEMIMDHNFNKTQRFLSNEAATHDKQKLIFYVFDDFTNPSDPYAKRFARVVERCKKINHPQIVALPHVQVDDAAAVLKCEEKIVADGYEGVMLRAMRAPYKYGRSTSNEGWLLKLKRFEDSEAMILEVLAEKGNNNPMTRNKLGGAKRSSEQAGKFLKDTCGSLRVKDCNKNSPMHGVEFKVGSGIDDSMGKFLWENADKLEGKAKITYRWQPSGSLDKPRFITFVSLVSKWDR